MMLKLVFYSIASKNEADRFINFEFSSVNDEINYDIVITKFKEYGFPRKNLTLTRYKFFNSRQDKAEKFNDFVNKFKTLSH